MNRVRLLGLAVGAGLLVLCCGLPLAAVLSPQPATACGAGPGGSLAVAPSGALGAVGRWNPEQVTNAAIIVQVGRARQVPARGWVIAVATAMQESTLHNYGNLGTRNDHDSLGLFQQRPSQGWGTPQQIMDPRYAAGKFYEKLVTIPGWQTLPVSQAAQRVQRSAFPSAYAKWEGDADHLVVAITHAGSLGDLPGASLMTCDGPTAVTSSGWTQPVHARIVSGFRTPQRPTHQGDDLGAARYTTIHAASGGRVVWAGCDPATGNCDIDGSLQTPGCGWYVEILHAHNIATRYCHMVQQPSVSLGQTVAVGDPIGLVGDSGHSSGPHLHFEVHLNVTCGPTRCSLTPDSAVDPNTWMASVGAPPQHIAAAATTAPQESPP